MALRRRPVPLRRGEFFPFVPAAVAPAAPARAPDWVQRRRPAPRRLARGEFFPVPGAAPQPASPIMSRRRPVRTAARRGELWQIPLVGAVAGFGPWLPPPMSRRRIPAQARRGKFLVVPLVGLASNQPPPVIPLLLTHRPTRVLPRRGEFLPVTPAPAFCAVPVPRRRRPSAATRRGRGWTAPPVSLPPPGPGPWLPRTLRAPLRLSPRRSSRGRYWPLSLESVCDCTTHRPSLGVTVRPGSGITARPGTGTTTRPCSCGNG